MASPAQIAANTQNAKHSTGPRTEEGKTASARNGTTHGLYAKGVVRPNDNDLYDKLKSELLAEFSPVGLHEQYLADEAFRAIWRLRRCAEVETNLSNKLNRLYGHENEFIPDPMEALGDSEKIQNTVDRARSQAHRHLRQSTIELRKLQTLRREAAIKAVSDEALNQKSETHPENANQTQSGIHPIYGHQLYPVPEQTPQTPPQTMRTQSDSPETPRNAPCPCGSRQKYKRCCGKIARPHLHAA